MNSRVLVFLFVICIESAGLWAQGNASTFFNVFVPPNNRNIQHNVSLVVTAIFDSTQFVITDDAQDGDDDDSVTGLLMAGESYVLFIKDNGINDDARYASDAELKHDGDYFTVKSNRNVLVSQSTGGNIKHTFVPSVDKYAAGKKFIFYSGISANNFSDFNVFVSRDSTLIELRRISQLPQINSGYTSIQHDSSELVLRKYLNIGDDLIYSDVSGRNLLEDGHTYVLESSDPLSIQYGSLFHDADGGGAQIPSVDGLAAGELFYFAVPCAEVANAFQKIQWVSLDENNEVKLEFYNGTSWELIHFGAMHLHETGSWQSPAGQPLRGLFRLICSEGKRIQASEWASLELGSDFGMQFSPYALSAHASGKEFIVNVPPPSNQDNVLNPETGLEFNESRVHIYLYAAENALVHVKDVHSNGELFSRTYQIGQESYALCSINEARWNLIHSNGSSLLKIESDQAIAIAVSSASSAWSNYLNSSLREGLTQQLHDTVQAGLPSGAVFQTIANIFPQGLISQPKAEILFDEGIELLHAELKRGNEVISDNFEFALHGNQRKAVFSNLPDYFEEDQLNIIAEMKVLQPASDTSFSDTIKLMNYSFLMEGFINNRKHQSAVNGTVVARFNSGNSSIFSMQNIPGMDTLLTDSWTCSCIDYNNDGRDDIFFTEKNQSRPNYLYSNEGNNQFNRITVGELIMNDMARSISSTWADVDNDGDLDVLVLNNLQSPNFYYLNNGNGTFTRNLLPGFANDVSYYHGASWVDYDNDGKLDIYLSNFWSTRFNELWHQEENGSFVQKDDNAISQTTSQTVGASWCDINNDGFQDLFIPGNEDAHNLLFINSGNGQFQRITSGDAVLSGGNSVGSCWGDIDNDGDMDLFVANNGNVNNELFLNDGSGNLVRRLNGPEVNSGGHSHGCSFADVDNDADLDLYVTNDEGNKFLYLNDGSGNFIEAENEIIMSDFGKAFGHSWCDTDNDGDLDLFVATHGNEPNYFFMNQGNENNWIKIKLEGRRTNRSAVGARIRVLSGGVWQMREVNSQSGLGGQSSYTQHFGLATNATIDSVQIRWPGGHIQKLGSMPINQSYQILEENTTEISGIIFADLNGNCIMDAGEPPIPGYTVNMQGTPLNAVTDENGVYTFLLADGFYSLQLSSTSNLSISCDSIFPLAVSDAIALVELVPLGLVPDCIHADASVTGFTTALRRGFDNFYQVQLINRGYGSSEPTMLYVNFPQGLSVVSTNPAFADSLSLDNGGTMLGFAVPALAPQQMVNFNIMYYVGLELNLGDEVLILSSLDLPGQDCDLTNNSYDDWQEIMGAFDPNDLLAWPEGVGAKRLITSDQRITYRIRFQNVGNFYATHVTLHDVIPEALDVESISGMHGSHPYFVSMHDNLLKVEFRNIYLPDSASNQEASNGYFEFEIGIKKDAVTGSKILNRAAITFDFNEPIYTNEISHTLVKPDRKGDDALVLFPNPASREFFIINPFEGEAVLHIYSLHGDSIRKSISATGLVQFNDLNLNSGFYIVEILSAAGEIRKAKLVIS